MNTPISLEEFSGPLDLLLSLVHEEKLDITAIALSQVTEQYIGYIEGLEESSGEELADFVVVAARLLLLKSSRLMPQFAPAEDEGPRLEDQLRLYQSFVKASKGFNLLWENDRQSRFRIEPPRVSEEFVMPANTTLASLYEFMVQLINRIKPAKPLPQTQIDRAISIKEKIANIRKLLRSKKKFSFQEVLEDSENKTDVIVGFLALLELVKQKHVGLKQEGNFGDIMVNRA